MKSCLYEGTIRHRRLTAPSRAFEYSLFMAYLDLAELETMFEGRWLWSAARPNLAWFRRADHYGDPRQPLDASIRTLVAERTGTRPSGPLRLLTHLRYFGHGFNPVSFFYCFDEADGAVETIVAEVNNTPWGERHMYVLPASDNLGRSDAMRFAFQKAFHVSPFLGMDMQYAWSFSPPGERLGVHMENVRVGERIFDATLTLERRSMTSASLARALALYPAMTVKVVGAIYWQALRLWLRGATFHPHPAVRAATPEAS